ncbi:MAG TPA: glycoside hydrolase family 2 TIM barrel-domain containing protein, partial [Phycisphaerae bacterium]|nr:glycoside hydrolase family 2 TIM barrel-domain containing protein [Phycisphaerae bacterium]
MDHATAVRGSLVLAGIMILVVATCAGTSQADETPLRVCVSLNADAATGIWTFRPVQAFDRDNDFKEPRKPVAIPPGPITVPAYWSDSNPEWDDDWSPMSNPRNKWIEQAEYSRTFDVPASMAGKRIKLHFGAVNHAAEARVNGKLAGPKHYQGTVPFACDITPLVRPGSAGNELKVMVWDHTGLRDAKDPSKYAWPVGHAMWAHKMSGIGQDVTLRAVPALHVADVRVVTSVEKMTVTVEVTVVNEDDRPHTVTVENEFRRITRLGPPEQSVPAKALNADQPVTVEGGAGKTVTLTAPWPEAQLWWPHRPQLYRLHTRLIEGGQAVDVKADTRFGFREFRIDPASGNRYNLNGLPFRGRGDTINTINRNIQHDRPALEYLLDTFKAFGVVLIRHGAAIPPPPLFWDVCDEKGMLCIEEMFFNGQNANHKGRPWNNGFMFYTNHYGDPAFERHVDEMARALVGRDRNHPSIVIWNIENEVFYNLLPYQPTEKQKDDVARVRKVIDALDGTRPVGCDHEGTLDGRLAIKNKHYPGTPAHLNDDFRAKAWTNWDPISADTDVYWVLKADPPKVPFGVGEFMFHRKKDLKDPNSILSPYHWGRLRAYQVRAFRLFGMSDIRVFTYGHDALTASWGLSTRGSHMVNRKSLSAVAVFDHDYDGRDPRLPPIAVDEDSTQRRLYDVYNDDLADTSTRITVNWQVRLLDKVTDSGSTTVTVPLATSKAVELAWQAPAVNADTDFIVSVEAVKSGRQVFTDFRTFTARDRGAPAVEVSDTFRDDFSGGPTPGWIEYDTFWRIADGAYVQPEVRGLFPFARPVRNNETGQWSAAKDPFPDNAHMAAIGPWTFGDLRASFEVKLLRAEGGEDGPW